MKKRERNVELVVFYAAILAACLLLPVILDVMGYGYIHTIILCGPLNLVIFLIEVVAAFSIFYYSGLFDRFCDRMVSHVEDEDEDED